MSGRTERALSTAIRTNSPTPTTSSEDMIVRIGDNPNAMSDARFIEMTTELLRADRTYRDQMFTVLASVRTGELQEGEGPAESSTEPATGIESIPEATLPSVALD